MFVYPFLLWLFLYSWESIILLFHHRSSLVRDSKDLQNAPSQNEEGSSPADTMEHAVGIAEETEEACNGEVFLKCVLENDVPDFDDLANFVACESGKDYSAWLKDREKYRKWKGEKMTVLRWKRKKKTWRIATGKKSEAHLQNR